MSKSKPESGPTTTRCFASPSLPRFTRELAMAVPLKIHSAKFQENIVLRSLHAVVILDDITRRYQEAHVSGNQGA
jgi:hypothetical protein